MQKYLYPVVIAAAGGIALAGCAPVHYHRCNLTCFQKPKPVVVKPVAPPPPPKPIAPIEHTILQSKPITIRGVNFTTNSAKLAGADFAVLDRVAKFARQHPKAVLLVKGYCSKTGSFAYNMKLSKARASSVAHYLFEHGVPAYRILTKGYSWLNPVASNATAEGRFLNQRVVIDSTIKVKKVIP